MTKQIALLVLDRLVLQFCRSFDKVMGCRQAHGTKTCECMSCPLNLFIKTLHICEEKDLSLGRGLKVALSATVPEDTAKEILREALSEKVAYPDKSLSNYTQAIKEIKHD